MIFFVLSETAECFPPITHPSAITQASSAITISLDVRVYILSLSASKLSPSFAKRICIFPVILSASKQWVGCPYR